jgi:hypothetical protein
MAEELDLAELEKWVGDMAVEYPGLPRDECQRLIALAREVEGMRRAARAFWRLAWSLAIQIRRDTGQPMTHTEVEMERLERLHPWISKEDEEEVDEDG